MVFFSIHTQSNNNFGSKNGYLKKIPLARNLCRPQSICLSRRTFFLGQVRAAYAGVVAQLEQILKSKPKRINDFKEESEMLAALEVAALEDDHMRF